MKAESLSLTFLANEGAILIPYFQRAYVWDEPNWKEMFDELLEFDKKHFLGSLILKQVEKQSGRAKQAIVIDGQQRLTTLSILLRALYDSFPEPLRETCKEDGKFDACLFYKKDRFESEIYTKIEHSKTDKEYYQKIIKSEIHADEIDYKNCTNKILKCYKYFSLRLDGVSENDRKKMFSDLLEPDNQLFVVIDIFDDDNEQSIFDTINSAGVWLSSADIVKNAIFQRAFELIKKKEKVEDLYKRTWESVFAANEDVIQFWDSKRTTGRLWRDNLEIFLHSFAVVEGFFDPEKHSIPDLAKIYKAHINGLDETSLTRLIETICEYADLYREKFLVFDKSDLFSFADYHKRLFHVLDVCDVSTFHPYVLYLYRKNAGNDEELEKALRKLESLVMRRAVCKSGTKNYNKLCKEFIADPSKLDMILAETNDDSVRDGLSNIDNKTASLILFWVELFRRHIEKHFDTDELKYAYTLEHIMPQKWEEYWTSIPVIDENGHIMPEGDAANDCRKKHIYSIGNMTLLKSSLNIALRNHEFQRKIEGEGRKRGVKDYAELSITKRDIVDPYMAGDRSWDEVKIRDRTSKIAEELLKIWGMDGM